MNALIRYSVRFTALLVMLLLATIGQAQDSERQKVVLPDFTLADNNGKPWSLSEHDGRPKVLMFWATWCPHCKKLFPTMQELHEQHHSRGLDVVAISAFDDGDTRAYVKDHGLTMTVLVNGDELARQLNVPGTPTVVVLDGENQIVYGAINPSPQDAGLKQAITRAFQNANVAGSKSSYRTSGDRT